jgi:hypothetical protein
MMLLLNFLDDPFHADIGGVQPEAMERTLVIIDEGLEAIGVELTLPCDEAGRPA